MKKSTWQRILKAIAIVIMLFSMPLIPDTEPWYYELIAFNIGLILFLAPKWPQLKKELGITK